MIAKELLQSHNQILIDDYNKYGPVVLGPYSSYTWRHDPKHLLFTLSRYKFCSKLLLGKESLLEIGCGDAIGIPILLQSLKTICAVDLESIIIDDNIRRNEYQNRVTFKVLDITKNSTFTQFDSIVCLDVIEHINYEQENNFLINIKNALKIDGICIIGTPNISCSNYASKNSQEGHVNLKSYDTLKASLHSIFNQVILFSMNDELVHTGFFPLAHYLFAVCSSPKK